MNVEATRSTTKAGRGITKGAATGIATDPNPVAQGAKIGRASTSRSSAASVQAELRAQVREATRAAVAKAAKKMITSLG